MKVKNWNGIVNSNPELKVAVSIIEKIDSLGYEAVLVGGFVRDTLLSIPNDDIDISSNIPEEELSKVYSITDIGKSKSFGIHVIKHKGFTFEISQFRKDIYDAIKGKGADSVEIVQTFKDDASRRDFTINAMGITHDGDIVDHFKGADDLINGCISTVGSADDRFDEDYVRMLRAIRFASKLKFGVDKGVVESIQRKASNITTVAWERIYKELYKMASQDGESFYQALMMMSDWGLLEHILPEITDMKPLYHSLEYHPEADGNVFGHVMEAVRCSRSTDPVVNLAILLHDVGKVPAYTKDENGKTHFYKHETYTKDIVMVIAERLKIDNSTRDAIIFAGENHMMMHVFEDLKNSKSVELFENKNWEVLRDTGYADAKCRTGQFDSEKWSKVLEKEKRLEEASRTSEARGALRKVVNGRYVMDRFGLTQADGKKIGFIIKGTMEWALDHNISADDTESLKRYMDNLYEISVI